ncbi:MAG TPA: TlpA disulfide reductase family protein [Anaerolineae bacterium]|nr:TlpA disulfide reductase family protein [Anaerolineae bacterium]
MKSHPIQKNADRSTLWSNTRSYLLIALFIAFGIAWTWFNRLPKVNASDAARTVAPHTNFMAPTFTLQSITSETLDLDALKGKVLLVNFWATWCPPCRAEMPAIDKAYRANKDAGFVVLAVDQQEDPRVVKAFGEKYNLTFPLLLDRDGSVNVLYGVSALPTSYFVDRRGVIRDMMIGGSMSSEFIEGKIKTLLEEKQ